MNDYLQTWRRSFNFSGRARRREFWAFVCVNAVLFSFVERILRMSVSIEEYETLARQALYCLVLVPTLAVTVRRLHDTDKSGGTIFIALIIIVGPLLLLACFLQDGQAGKNRFGPDPKNRPSDDPSSLRLMACTPVE
ncbi:MAG: DUF805 domain-containing protein [Planctomyces sp.]|uniref:DUF805 domain-containing protein n=1 Tax=Rubinisphaera brasiliensis (strain ATCC 49424 / DSM 5305 / JCM 21570 / IAM 15109 / NBRC 103401 / IFAM 1448) TaxID=756272 RepID=F0SKJ0_RUBBR|nr:DUF805 domain-containing protein [Rubinisphaera brasiliensis]ADY61971.1 protein of unknown function DUF805 [Rubinisphaera brasiliensis DSM 5305]MBB03536.1 DUF805 domain-containing protein [Planctomyces sp.]